MARKETKDRLLKIKIQYMKYTLKAPPSLTEQTLSFEIPDLPQTITPVISGTTPVDNANQLPIVNAGVDLVITLPKSEAILTASGSDPDGTIDSWFWEKLSGGAAVIESPNTVGTKISGMTVAGVYTFRVSGTDNKGAKKSDDVKVTVQPATTPPTPAGVYEGFGSAVTGGDKTGNTVFVNSLTETALKNAIGTGNRIVKFNVTGTIKARLEFSNLKNLTLDGEGKILIDNGPNGDAFAFEGSGCDNIIVKNLRVRNAGNDTMGIRCKNVVIDHCSFDKSGDGLCDMTDSAENITISYCIFGDSEAGPMLLAYAGTRKITVYMCAFTGWERNPLIHRANNYQPTETEDLMCEFVNNIVWGWDRIGSWVDYGGTAQFKNNFYQKADGAIRVNVDSEKGKIFCSGNIAKGGAAVGTSNHTEWTIPTANRVTLLAPAAAAAKIKAEAGPRPLDARDKAILDQISL